MNDQDDNIEKFYKSQFKDYKVSPPEGLEEDIFSSVKKDNRIWKIKKWRFVFLILLLFVFIGLGYFVDTEKPSDSETSQQTYNEAKNNTGNVELKKEATIENISFLEERKSDAQTSSEEKTNSDKKPSIKVKNTRKTTLIKAKQENYKTINQTKSDTANKREKALSSKQQTQANKRSNRVKNLNSLANEKKSEDLENDQKQEHEETQNRSFNESEQIGQNTKKTDASIESKEDPKIENTAKQQNNENIVVNAKDSEKQKDLLIDKGTSADSTEKKTDETTLNTANTVEKDTNELSPNRKDKATKSTLISSEDNDSSEVASDTIVNKELVELEKKDSLPMVAPVLADSTNNNKTKDTTQKHFKFGVGALGGTMNFNKQSDSLTYSTSVLGGIKGQVNYKNWVFETGLIANRHSINSLIGKQTDTVISSTTIYYGDTALTEDGEIFSIYFDSSRVVGYDYDTTREISEIKLSDLDLQYITIPFSFGKAHTYKEHYFEANIGLNFSLLSNYNQVSNKINEVEDQIQISRSVVNYHLKTSYGYYLSKHSLLGMSFLMMRGKNYHLMKKKDIGNYYTFYNIQINYTWLFN